MQNFLKKLLSTDERADTPDSTLRTRRQRFAFIAFALGIPAALIALVTESEEKPHEKPVEPAKFSLIENTDRESFLTRFDVRVTGMEKAISTLRRDLTAAENEKAALNRSLSEISAALSKLNTEAARRDAESESREAALKAEIATLKAQTGNAPSAPAAPAEPDHEALPGIEETLGLTDPESYRRESPQTKALSPAAFVEVAGHTAAPAAPDAAGLPSHLKELRITDDPAQKTSTLSATGERAQGTAKPVLASAPMLAPDTPIALNRAEGTRRYIAAGSFAPATLLTGVIAATGTGSTSVEMPVLMRLSEVTTLPNELAADLQGCFVTGQAAGDLSTERIQIRLDRLSCSAAPGAHLDLKVMGYVVGEDGKVGIRGRLVSRSGQAIASALSLGIMSGIGKALSLSSQETTTSALGTQTTSVTNAYKNGLGQGMGQALDRLVDYYLKIANQIFPVLESHSGRRVQVVFSQGVMIEPGHFDKAGPQGSPAPRKPRSH